MYPFVISSGLLFVGTSKGRCFPVLVESITVALCNTCHGLTQYMPVARSRIMKKISCQQT